MKTFNYNPEYLFSSSFEVESVGNVCLEAIDEEGSYHYLVMITSLGITTHLEFGPLCKDDDLLPDKHTIIFSRFEFSEKSACKVINDFLKLKQSALNPKKKVKICEINIVEKDYVLDQGINVYAYLRDYNDASNY